MPWIGKIIGIALAYLALGRLARLLNVPPDYVTPLFPPAGLAVGALVIWGYRTWPGIFLGAVLLNSTLPWEHGFSLASTDMARGLIIAVGAVLQACAGTWMIQRWVGLPNTLAHERSIALFLLLAGPVACVINATIGTTALALTGDLPAQAAPRTWILWWIGDSFGVLIIAPLLLAFFGEPAQAWRPRRFAVGVPLAFTFAAVVVVYYLGSLWEQQRIHNELRMHMDVAADRLRNQLNDALRLLHSVRHFYVATGEIERHSFHAFISDSLSSLKAVEALLWLRHVPAAQQTLFETTRHGSDVPPFRIWEVDAQGKPRPAHAVRDRIVVEFAEPAAPTQHLVGLDVSALGKLNEALKNTLHWNHVAAIGPLPLPAPIAWPRGLELYLAIGVPTEHGAATAAPFGYTGVALNLEKIMGDALNGIAASDLAIAVTLGASEPTVLWQQRPRRSDGGRFPVERYRIDIPVGFDDCAFYLSATPSAAYLARVYSWQSWGVLLVGFALTAVVGTLLLVITGRTVKVEAVVEERTAALRNSESRLRAVLENAGDGIVTLDAHGNIESANPAAHALLGYDPPQLVGKAFTSLLAENCRTRLRELLGAPAGTTSARLTEVEALTKSGSLVPLELSMGEIRLDTQRCITLVLHDLTERRRIDELKDAFISNVSHELRTPLTSIRGSLGLLTGGATGKMPQGAARLIEIAANNAERLSRLVNDILDIEKIESDKMQLELRPARIVPLIEHTMVANQGFADSFQVSLHLRSELDADACCDLDADRFVQALTNLISNAVKFSPTGGVVDIHLRRQDHAVRIAVQDYGPGIPMEFQPRIFQKFARADTADSRRAPGTGLGLSISKVLVERMHGTLRYETAPGRGTTFIMEFPLAGGDEPKP